MQIHSSLLHALIELDAYVNNDNNIIITHKALVDFIQQMDEIYVDYQVVKAEMTHAVVMCNLVSKQYGKRHTEFGETTKETLGKNFSNYPVITAQEMAFDRAVIKFLQLPDNCYSVLEFLRNCSLPEELKQEPEVKKEKKEKPEKSSEIPKDNKEQRVEKPEKKAGSPVKEQNVQKTQEQKPQTQSQTSQKKGDAKDYVVEFGIFAGSGATVQQVFRQAYQDAKVRATLDLYLTKNPSDIPTTRERYSIVALQKYAKQIGYGTAK